MADKTYLDFYRERVFRTGSSAQERASNSLNSDFMQLVKTSPNSVEIEYQGLKYQCILNSGNSRVGAQTERKVIQYLLTDLDLKLPEGAVFTMHQSLESETTTWLVLHREIHSFYGYYKFKIIELDYQLNYVDKNGIVKTVPAYINGTGEFDIKAYFRYSFFKFLNLKRLFQIIYNIINYLPILFFLKKVGISKSLDELSLEVLEEITVEAFLFLHASATIFSYPGIPLVLSFSFSKPVAITVIWISSPIESSVTVPKIILASGSALR